LFLRQETGEMVAENDNNAPQVVGIKFNSIVSRVWRLTEPLCLGEGLELVHIEYQREPAGRTLRIYLDKPGGVTLDDCVNISRQLGDLLDVGLETELSYRMEVSSPGLDRPLGKLGDFERFRGCRAKIRTARPIDGRKNFTGILEGIDGESIMLLVDREIMSIALADIAKAHLINYNGESPCL
jgi:ribosome maturation factor RimP